MSLLKVDIYQKPIKNVPITVVVLSGALERKTTVQLDAKLSPVLKQKTPNVIFNFEKITYINNAGMELLVDIADRGKKFQAKYFLTKIAPKMKVMFDSMGITSLFFMAKDLQMAFEKILETTLRENSLDAAQITTNKYQVFAPTSLHGRNFVSKVKKKVDSGRFELPLLPNTALQLMEMSSNPRSTPQELEKLIHTDPTIAGNLLKIANSCVYAGRFPISSISSAIVRLGRKRLRSMIVGITLSSKVIKGKKVDILARKLWQHSSYCAYIGGAIARSLKKDDNIAFSAGLLHDIHKAILLNIARTILGKESDYFPSSQVLNFIYEEHFSQVFQKVCKQWLLPESLAQSIKEAHNFSHANKKTPEMAIISMADKIAEYIEGENEYLDIATELQFLKLSVPKVEALFKEILQLHEELKQSA